MNIAFSGTFSSEFMLKKQIVQERLHEHQKYEVLFLVTLIEEY